MEFQMKTDIESKTALITGGAKGIGLAAAKRLAAENCRLILWDMDEHALSHAADVLSSFGVRVIAEVCDITKVEASRKHLESAVSKTGPVDLLVNNAGFVSGKHLHEMEQSDIERSVTVNLTALVNLTRLVIPGMYENNFGFIVNLSSAAGILGVARLPVYSATKWAVWGFSEALRHEAANLGKTGVHIASVHPGYIRKGMFAGARIPWPGGLLVPRIKSHDQVAKAIVEKAIKRRKTRVLIPGSIRLAILLRGLLPDRVFNWYLRFLGIQRSMESHKGRS